MTRPEIWLRQPEIVRQALDERKTLCKQRKCPDIDKVGAFCPDFWSLYFSICKAEEHLWVSD